MNLCASTKTLADMCPQSWLWVKVCSELKSHRNAGSCLPSAARTWAALVSACRMTGRRDGSHSWGAWAVWADPGPLAQRALCCTEPALNIQSTLDSHRHSRARTHTRRQLGNVSLNYRIVRTETNNCLLSKCQLVLPPGKITMPCSDNKKNLCYDNSLPVS